MRAEPGVGNGHSKLTHAQDVGRALPHTDAAARVEHVEDVRALQAIVQRRQRQARIEQLLGEAVVLLEQIAVEGGELAVRQGDLAERVLRLLHFVAEPHIPIRHARRPLQVVHVIHTL